MLSMLEIWWVQWVLESLLSNSLNSRKLKKKKKPKYIYIFSIFNNIVKLGIILDVPTVTDRD